MSAVISIKGEDAIFLLTDGAVYSPDKILVDRATKLRRAPTVPMAIACRGMEAAGNQAADTIIGWAEDVGVDEAIATMRDALHIWAIRDDLTNVMELTVAAIDGNGDPRHYRFANVEMTGSVVPADTLFELGQSFVGCSTSVPEPAMPVLRKQHTGERVVTYLSEIGPLLMQHYRDQKVPPSPWCSHVHPEHVVGGFVELTVVNTDGVQSVILHDWDDPIGELIDPAKNRVRGSETTAGNVVSIAGNRSERRTLRRRAA